MPIIRTDNMIKQFSDVRAVDGVSLRVERGEIYGFVGLNGAGKTTTIRMLLGMMKPSSGKAYIMGNVVDAGEYDLWQHVGYMVETPHAYPELTVWQNLRVMGMFRSISNKRSIERAIRLLRLAPYQHRKAQHLSLGNKQRLGLAKALLHKPSILILDEPTNGLDPAGIVEIRQLLHGLAHDRGVTIFLSSHLLSEIAQLATRLGIIHQGRLVKELDRKQLQAQQRQYVILDTRDNEKAYNVLQHAGYTVRFVKERSIRYLRILGEKAVSQREHIAKILVHADLPPTLLKKEQENLETFFLRIVEEGG